MCALGRNTTSSLVYLLLLLLLLNRLNANKNIGKPKAIHLCETRKRFSHIQHLIQTQHTSDECEPRVRCVCESVAPLQIANYCSNGTANILTHAAERRATNQVLSGKHREWKYEREAHSPTESGGFRRHSLQWYVAIHLMDLMVPHADRAGRSHVLYRTLVRAATSSDTIYFFTIYFFGGCGATHIYVHAIHTYIFRSQNDTNYYYYYAGEFPFGYGDIGATGDFDCRPIIRCALFQHGRSASALCLHCCCSSTSSSSSSHKQHKLE